MEKILGFSRLASRLLRLGIRTGLPIDDENVVLSIGNILFELNVEEGGISNGWFCGEGIRPLIITSVKGIKGFSDGLYFGGYFQNPDKKSVNIYHRKSKDLWEIVYTFPVGSINHVHTIVPDSYRNCLWVFTGDFGEGAAIWRVADGFRKVERIVGGDQKWRGCVAFATSKGLLYATDTPFSDNHIYQLKDDFSVEILADICGSCIYGCQWKDQYVFSSTVEPDGRDESIIKLLFSKKRGCGIVDNYMRLYIGDHINGFKEVYKDKKDWFPFLFQFGTFKFPTGINNSESIYFQPVAANKHDLDLMMFT